MRSLDESFDLLLRFANFLDDGGVSTLRRLRDEHDVEARAELRSINDHVRAVYSHADALVKIAEKHQREERRAG